jgi:hypothetical protein
MRVNAWGRITAVTIAVGIFAGACGDDGGGGGTKQEFCRTATNLANNPPQGAAEVEIYGGTFVTYPAADLNKLADDAPSELTDEFSAIEGNKPKPNATQKINTYLNEECGTRGLLVRGGILLGRT